MCKRRSYRTPPGVFGSSLFPRAPLAWGWPVGGGRLHPLWKRFTVASCDGLWLPPCLAAGDDRGGSCGLYRRWAAAAQRMIRTGLCPRLSGPGSPRPATVRPAGVFAVSVISCGYEPSNHIYAALATPTASFPASQPPLRLLPALIQRRHSPCCARLGHPDLTRSFRSNALNGNGLQRQCPPCRLDLGRPRAPPHPSPMCLPMCDGVCG